MSWWDWKTIICTFSCLIVGPTLGSAGSILLSCDFDGVNPCQKVKNGSVGDLTWDQGIRSTPSGDTGPTDGVGDPGFIFVEATDKEEGKFARLESVRLYHVGDVCVDFYYSMYGEHMGSLSLGVMLAERERRVWTLSGDQGKGWKHYTKTLTLTDAMQMLVWTGVRGRDYRSDMALDNIKVTTGGCDDILSPNTQLLECPFDSLSSNTCPITQDTDDDGDWAVLFRRTPSDDTGPEGGYDGSPGFIYYEASNKVAGHRARFALPQLIKSGTLSCARVSFYYHMYGQHMGALAVYTRQGNDQRWAMIRFFKYWNQGNKWHSASFDVAFTVDSSTRIVFEAVRGTGYAGDIAVDAIRVTDCTDGQPLPGTTVMPLSDGPGGDGCGAPYFKPRLASGRIVNGKEASPHSWPWQISLRVEALPRCGGAVLSDRWVVTAAHCVSGLENTPNSLRVVAGVHRIFETEATSQDILVSQVILHEDFRNDNTFDYDIALLKLQRPLSMNPYVKPLCLPRGAVGDHVTCVTTGWGATGGKGDPSVLNQAEVPVIPTVTCNQRDWYNNAVTRRMVCAGFPEGIVDSCQYDAGGPLMCQQADKSWVLHGLTSWGSGCARPQSPGVYTRVSEFTDWLVKHTNGAVSFGDGNGGNGDGDGGNGDGDGGNGDGDGGNGGGDGGNGEGDGDGKILIKCDFDGKGPCQGLSNGTGSLKWRPGRMKTPSDGTGPTNGVSDLNFIYMEASMPAIEGQTAMLQSDELGYTGDICVDFHYSMFGLHMGSLHLSTELYGMRREVWSLSGNQGNAWKPYSDTLTLIDVRQKLVWAGVRGNGYQSDIALDKIEVTTGACSGPSSGLLLECHFDSPSNNCSIIQDRDDDGDWTVWYQRTPSDMTGPERGYGASQGFIYYEATGKRTGDTSRFVLPQLVQSGSLTCARVEFTYHMYGQNMGAFTVYTRQGRDQRGAITRFSRVGNQGNQWHMASFDVAMDTSTRVVFESIRGNEYASDIAVDAIRVTDCANSGPPATSSSTSSTTPSSTTPTTTTTITSTTTTTPTTRAPTATTITVPSGGLLLECLFDSPTNNCSIRQDTSDDDDWSVSYQGTQSKNTGPNTGFEGSQGFIYYEASYRRTGNKARFTLPQLIPSGSLSCARVEFHYHMYGYHMGRLNVHTRQGNDQGTVKTRFTKSGDQGNLWHTAGFDFMVDTSTRLVFESVRGNGYSSDIAVDFIRVTDCSTAPPQGLPLECPFDSPSNNCPITQDTNDGGNWTVSYTGTASSQTGPDTGYGSSQGFIYYEASGKTRGDKSRFVLPQVVKSGSLPCARVQFFYHMYGSEMGTLQVYTREGTNQNRAVSRFSKQENQGNQWHKAMFDVPISTSSRIVFESTRGDGYRSDIAVDEIRITECSAVTETGDCGMPHFQPIIVLSLKIGEIVNGKEAVPHSWPWQIIIRLPSTYAGGVVLSEGWIVTAAHAVYKARNTPEDIAGVAGIHKANDPESTKQEFLVSQVIVHENYIDDGTYRHDIALLRLMSPLTINNYVRPVCLPRGAVRDNTLCVATGWGYTQGTGDSGLLNQVQVPVIPTDRCNQRDWYDNRVTRNMFCAGYEQGMRDSCSGDSGGPLVSNQAGRWVLHGITSWGQGCARPRKPGVYTRVSMFTDWIAQHTNGDVSFEQ